MATHNSIPLDRIGQSTPAPAHSSSSAAARHVAFDLDRDGEPDADLDEDDVGLPLTSTPVARQTPTTSTHQVPVSRRRRRGTPKHWKHRLHALLESPNSSPSAFMVHVVSTSLIVFSAAITILETLPALHSHSYSRGGGEGFDPGRVWFGIETALVAMFTVEYIARALAWSTDWRRFLGWFGSFFAIIDLLAIVPYYIEIALQADTSAFFRFSILRTFRLLRVFRPFRYSNTILLTIEVMFLSFQRSKDALLALSFFLVFTLVVFSTLIYFAERGVWDDSLGTFVDADGEPSQFESIPAAAWFVLVTITTVGYGDLVPRSFLGRLITMPLLLSGLLLIALPSFVLGREFASIWERMSRGGGVDADHHDHDESMGSPTLHPFSQHGRSQSISSLMNTGDASRNSFSLSAGARVLFDALSSPRRGQTDVDSPGPDQDPPPRSGGEEGELAQALKEMLRLREEVDRVVKVVGRAVEQQDLRRRGQGGNGIQQGHL